MHYIKPTTEVYTLTSLEFDIIDLSVLFLKKIMSELSTDDMKQKIMEREEIGDTFIGNETVLLHVISKKIKQEIGLYLFLQEQKPWHSIYSNHDYKINRVIILCINPQYQAHNFKYLNWATEYNFMNKIGKWQKEELYYL